MGEFGAAVPRARGDLRLPVVEGRVRCRVAGVFVEGKHPVFAGELVVTERRIVGGARGQAEATDLGARRGVLDGEGVGVGVEASLPLGGPEGLGRVGASGVVVDERCDGAIRGTFANCLFGGRPQNGRVVGGVRGCDGRCGGEAKHGGRENRCSEHTDDGSSPHECNSFVSMGLMAGNLRLSKGIPQYLSRVSFL